MNQRISKKVQLPPEEHADEIILTLGFPNTLLGFQKESWEHLIDCLQQNTELPEKRSRLLLRMFLSSSVLVEPDDAQRFRIPDRLWAYLGGGGPIGKAKLYRMEEYAEQNPEMVQKMNRLMRNYADYIISAAVTAH